LGVEIVPTRISILADNTRQNTGHAYVQLVSNKKEKRALSIWRKQDTAVFNLMLQ
jgi:tRNA/tmRNA/rRNA uracil-C5-methylase (TrmA/RlmC/RlmD family)